MHVIDSYLNFLQEELKKEKEEPKKKPARGRGKKAENSGTITKSHNSSFTDIQPGKPAPHFESIDENEDTVSNKSLADKNYILYFYPKGNPHSFLFSFQ